MMVVQILITRKMLSFTKDFKDIEEANLKIFSHYCEIFPLTSFFWDNRGGKYFVAEFSLPTVVSKVGQKKKSQNHISFMSDRFDLIFKGCLVEDEQKVTFTWHCVGISFDGNCLKPKNCLFRQKESVFPVTNQIWT